MFVFIVFFHFISFHEEEVLLQMLPSPGEALTCPNTLNSFSHGIKQAKIQMFIWVIFYLARDLEKAKREESERSNGQGVSDKMLLMGSVELIVLSLTHIIETCSLCLYSQIYLSCLYHSWTKYHSVF